MKEASESLQDVTSGNTWTAAGHSVDILIAAVQELSLARNLDTIMVIVRRAARELTGADGATFVLRDGDLCFYAEENAIQPLWKGLRFPMTACISGWTMMNRKPAVIEDIYSDARIPIDAYRPTFVKSLAMVPIRTAAPVGAIGNYWAERHQAGPQEVRLLQALADSTSIAMENVKLYGELEQRVRERTAQLEVANKELESFSYSVSHDLRAPLRAIDGFSRMLERDSAETLGEKGRGHLQRIRAAAGRMDQLTEDLLSLARVTTLEIERKKIDLSRMARDILEILRQQAPDREAEIRIADGIEASCDGRLVKAVLENLLSNAWKYTSKQPSARIEFGVEEGLDKIRAFFVKDNGAGFDMTYAGRLFGAFQRLHSDKEFPGNGVGLATVQRIVRKHGGRVWAESEPGKGATFRFTLE
jgi:signal transduction histidine kinase